MERLRSRIAGRILASQARIPSSLNFRDRIKMPENLNPFGNFGFKFLIMMALSTILALPLSPMAQQVSVDGEWELVTQTRSGDVTWKVVFAQEGGSITVTMTGPRGGEAKGTGTLKEAVIEWTVKVATPRGALEMAYKGVVEGDMMSGVVRRGNIGTAAWTAKRKTA